MWTRIRFLFLLVIALANASAAQAAVPAIPFTVTMSEAVNVTGTPRIVLDVGGTTRYATYSSGTGTSSLTFTYTATAGDVDLDGIGIASTTLDLNGGALTDLNGNPETNLTFIAPANMGSINVNYPSLSMDFIADADGRYSLNGTVYNDLTSFLTASGGTFSRASVGTYFDSTGTLQTAASGTPRFDYDPVTHAAKGILIEESRTNLFTRSSEVDNSAWYKAGGGANVTVTANAATSPDGTTTADLVESTGVSNSFVSIGAPFSAGNTVTWSAYAKAGTSSRLIFECGDNGSYIATTFNLSTLSVTPGAGVTASIQSVGNGWYRLVATRTFVQSSASAFVGTFYIDTYGTAPAGRNIYIWGAQAEIGSFITSYIPTTSTTVTRAADVFTLPTGSWYNSTESTVYSQYQVPYSTSGQHGVFSLNDGTLSNKTDLRANGQMITSLAGASQENQTVAINIGSTNRVSKGIILNNFSGSSNGSAVVTDNSVNVPSVNKLQIGGLDNSSTYGLDGTVEKIKYYPLRAANTQLQLMTQ